MIDVELAPILQNDGHIAVGGMWPAYAGDRTRNLCRCLGIGDRHDHQAKTKKQQSRGGSKPCSNLSQTYHMVPNIHRSMHLCQRTPYIAWRSHPSHNLSTHSRT